MPAVALPGKNLPLPVQMFSAAMEQQVPLATYASHVGLAIERVYEALTTQPSELQTDMLASLARTYHQPAEALRNTPTVPSLDETFGAWLKRNMEGVTQLALRKRAQMEMRELKAFLDETTLPDSDQAERLARALYINRTEVARTIVANMIRRAAQDPAAGRATLQTPATAAAERPARARRRVVQAGESASLSQSEQASAASEPATAAAPIEQPGDPAPAASKPTRPPKARRRPVTPASSASASTGQAAAHTRAESTALMESKRAEDTQAEPPQDLAPADNSATARPDVPVLAPLELASGAPARANPARYAKTGSEAAPALAASSALDQPDLTPESILPVASGAAPAPATSSVADRLDLAHAGTQPAKQERTQLSEKKLARRAQTDRPSSNVFLEPDSAVAVSSSEAHTAHASNPLGLAVATAAAQAGLATQPAGAKSSAAPEQATNPILARAARPKNSSSRERRSSQNELAPAIQATKPEAGQASAPAATPAQAQSSALAEPQTARTVPKAPIAPVQAHEARNQTAIQLSAEELRLLRRWRQLHPQGQRATLLYIASLLLEE